MFWSPKFQHFLLATLDILSKRVIPSSNVRTTHWALQVIPVECLLVSPLNWLFDVVVLVWMDLVLLPLL